MIKPTKPKFFGLGHAAERERLREQAQRLAEKQLKDATEFDPLPDLRDLLPGTNLRIWTAWSDHFDFLTGEGQTLCALVCYAEDEHSCRTKFARAFGDGCECDVALGVAENAVTIFLFSAQALAHFAQVEYGAELLAMSKVHNINA